MIRTQTVQLNSIEGVAYRQKLTAGGSGITVITANDKAVATINKRDGSFAHYGKVNEKVFTDEIFNEAVALTNGLPYRLLGSVQLTGFENKEAKTVENSSDAQEDTEKADVTVVCSKTYDDFIAAYTDKNGKFSYQLMNKDLIQFASKSKKVTELINDKRGDDEIVRYIVNIKASNLNKGLEMDDEGTKAFVELLDSMEARSAFKELKVWLREQMKRK
ncbi:MAG: hypothetical protein FWG90_07010 [Oscillospiraceae bacterium]|nr:hypothetical protein [Oscillospiraceae bacterium]